MRENELVDVVLETRRAKGIGRDERMTAVSAGERQLFKAQTEKLKVTVNERTSRREMETAYLTLRAPGTPKTMDHGTLTHEMLHCRLDRLPNRSSILCERGQPVCWCSFAGTFCVGLGMDLVWPIRARSRKGTLGASWRGDR